MHILVNGYGVPQHIFTDPAYHSYLGQVFNHLWDHYCNKRLVIVLCGGKTDMHKPYKRTEAGEMARWFKKRLKEQGLSKQWAATEVARELSALENLLAAKKLVGNSPVIYFCERTREAKARVLVRKIYGSRARVISIDFDQSPARYDTVTRTALEKEDLAYSLRALRDPVWRKKLKAANAAKVRRLRKLSPAQRSLEVDKLALKVRREYLKKLI